MKKENNVLPKKITLVEVGPRDGFQNVKTQISTADKTSIIKGMIRAGVRQMEITSFVNPKWVPQMQDASEVSQEILQTAPDDFRAIALAPNIRGVENARKAGLKNVTYVLSASESHNMKNVNRSISKSLEELREICREFTDMAVRVSLAVSFGCPFEGEVPLWKVISALEKICDAGVREVVLCDTIGVGNPLQVRNTVSAVKEYFSQLNLGLHFHDTRGMGIANIYAGYLEGITVFETSIGGLGGCPFAPGSAGNTATEDMLHMMSCMGVEHGVDLDEFLKTAQVVREKVDAPLTGRLICQCACGK